MATEFVVDVNLGILDQVVVCVHGVDGNLVNVSRAVLELGTPVARSRACLRNEARRGPRGLRLGEVDVVLWIPSQDSELSCQDFVGSVGFLARARSDAGEFDGVEPFPLVLPDMVGHLL